MHRIMRYYESLKPLTMINDDQLSYLRQQLIQGHLHRPDLVDDLVDHFACVIEELMLDGIAFEEAFAVAFRKISPNGPKEIEKDLTYLLTIKRKTMFRKTAYLFGYLSLILILSGLLFVPFFQQNELSDRPSVEKLAAISGVSIDEDFQLLALSDLAQRPVKRSLAEIFWVSGFALFLLTVVPFWFYKGYQKSMLKLQNQ